MSQGLGALLEASLDPRSNKSAETTLRQEEQKPGFSLQLLHITASQDVPYNTRLASALCFKNFIKRNWTDEDGTHKLAQDEVETLKRELISLMISVPPGIQSQLGEAVSVIADSDFWENWDTLVDDLVSKLSPANPTVNIGVLQVAHSIFKRWRPLFQSDALYTEINHVLGKFGTPFLALFEALDSYLEQNKTNKENLTQGFSQLNLMVKLFYDLSSHDLPPMFEDNIAGIATIFLKYLTYDNPLLQTDDDTEAGLLEYVRAGIFEALTLYVQKYMDVFQPQVGQFIGSSWNFLSTIGQETKYDILVSRALHFLTSVAGMPEHAASFQAEETLGQIVEKVVLPNVSLRESDEELFEDEPIEFIRRDLEGSDSETRRRAATDFLRKLAEKFEEPVTRVVLKYTEHYLAEYAKDASNWKAKDTATYLYSAIAAKGTATASHGVTATNQLVSITDYFQQNLAADLISEDGVHPILKVDAIKYLYTFRSIITKEQWQQVLPVLVKHLASSNFVVYTYAAIALERVLYLTDAQGQPVIPPTEITPLAKDLLEHIFQLIQSNPAPEKVQENEFLMRCVMRVLVVIKEGVVPHTDIVLQRFINITNIISANPSNPRFYYFHFEAMGAFIRFAAPANPDKLEQALYAPFAGILQNDVQEFMPYVFQLFAALLEANQSATLPTYYQELIGPVLMPVMWDSKGNTPALVRLLSSIIPRGSQYIIEHNQIEPILGIFQKLVSTKANESFAFDLLETCVASFPPAALENYFVMIMQIILQRLQNSKTENLTLRFVRFFHFISNQDDKGYSADFIIQVTDKVQEGLFTPIYINVILPETQKLARPLDRKTAILSFAKTLANSEAFATPSGASPLPASRDDIIADADTEDMSFGVGFTPLNTIRAVQKDPWPETGADLKVWVGTYLKEADKKQNGRVSQFASTRLDDQSKAMLGSYIS
ncbi:Armadillo-like helical [Penicillium brevicompactum]|uniref:Armadillo-like helical n=1 Tax=Penicillium brevicompactum TaxID=5074 RepID=A0A9W9QQM5_PENBR|nr:Armadillo-like helical [Penicillium brevicompactum]KAJ5326387.1 Armadillo-like helical [Penicillium brevicompactum]KAJ5338809.1 Armadillo-like helical [Penicillium brevicompactum]KAJ5341650.1 Armadillo-like helical [Penicillium brevicompactum]